MRIFLNKIIDWLIIIFLFLLPWQTRWIWQLGEINGAPWEYGTYSIYGTEILLWLIVILFAFYKLRHKEFWKKITSTEHFQTHKNYLFFAGGFILFLVIAIWHSRDIWLSYNYVFYLLGALCLFLIITENFSSKFLWAIWSGGVMQGLLAFGQFSNQLIIGNKWLGIATHDPSDLGVAVIEFGNERWLRAYGSFGWPNSLGIYLAVLLILGLVMYLRAEKRWLKILLSLGQVIITIGLVLSFSRTAWLAAASGFILLVVLQIRKSNYLNFLKQIIFISLPIVILFIIFQPLFFTRFNLSDRLEARSVGERISQYIEFQEVFFSHPLLGAGPGAYTLALADLHPQVKAFDLQPVHNIYLLILAEWGIVGAIVWLVVYVFIVGQIGRTNKIFLPVVSVLLIASFFDHWSYTLYTGMVLWWVILGLSVSYRVK